MSILGFFEFLKVLLDLFKSYEKHKDEKWFRDLIEVNRVLANAKTPDEKKDAAKKLAELISGS